jgi:hypothetical protein
MRTAAWVILSVCFLVARGWTFFHFEQSQLNWFCETPRFVALFTRSHMLVHILSQLKPIHTPLPPTYLYKLYRPNGTPVVTLNVIHGTRGKLYSAQVQAWIFKLKVTPAVLIAYLWGQWDDTVNICLRDLGLWYEYWVLERPAKCLMVDCSIIGVGPSCLALKESAYLLYTHIPGPNKSKLHAGRN